MIVGSRIIIIDDGKILFIHRKKNGRDYYVLPGGTIEEGETPLQTVIREAKEETNLDVEIDRHLWQVEETVRGEKRKCHFFLASGFNGDLRLGGPEALTQSEDNQYIFEWLPIDGLDGRLIFPTGVKEELERRLLKKGIAK